jgi:hypothetical protein
MNKSTLAMQLRGYFTRQGHTLKKMLNRSDDAVIGMVAGRCEWCGQTHIYGEKLDQLIAVSSDEKHFRSLWNDSNNGACLKS